MDINQARQQHEINWKLFDFILLKSVVNSPGTRVGPCYRDQMLAVKSRKKTHVDDCNFIEFLHIPSSWVKIGWHTGNQLSGPPDVGVGEKQCTPHGEEERKKCVLTISSYMPATAWLAHTTNQVKKNV